MIITQNRYLPLKLTEKKYTQLNPLNQYLLKYCHERRSLWIEDFFFMYQCNFIAPAIRHFCYLLLVSFKVNISVNGLSGKIGFHGR